MVRLHRLYRAKAYLKDFLKDNPFPSMISTIRKYKNVSGQFFIYSRNRTLKYGQYIDGVSLSKNLLFELQNVQGKKVAHLSHCYENKFQNTNNA